MERNLLNYIKQDLPNKIVLVMGPRQSGKTTIARQLSDNYDYFNYDVAEDRVALQKKSWDRDKSLLILDELHKMRNWKRWLKGVYDTEGLSPNIIVTGSARLDIHRRVGDSLAGRYFAYRLHPLDLKEILLITTETKENAFKKLWECSGYPEPYLNGDIVYYRRWRKTHLDIILRQDLIDFASVRDIQAIETLVELLKGRVGGMVSYANLARDLDRDPHTIKRWLTLLENLYVIYKVTPYHNKLARAIKKEPKYYFYDHTYADEATGARLENLVANALLKELHFLEDTKGVKAELHFLRTKDGKEIDFLINIENKPKYLIEVKTSDSKPSNNFKYFAKRFPDIEKIQLVKKLSRDTTFPDGLQIRALIPWICKFELKI